MAPRTTRPVMPGYGIPESLDGALDWSWAAERLARARNYFVATASPDGRPHVMPVWGVWLDDRFCFSTARTSVKSRNLSADPRCAVTIEYAHESVTIEGTARVADLDDVPGFVETYRDKYATTITDGPIWVVEPSVAFGFVETEEDFARAATRWTF